MDTKDAGKQGGIAAWKDKTAEERSKIMAERNRKAWVHRPRKRENASQKTR